MKDAINFYFLLYNSFDLYNFELILKNLLKYYRNEINKFKEVKSL